MNEAKKTNQETEKELQGNVPRSAALGARIAAAAVMMAQVIVSIAGAFRKSRRQLPASAETPSTPETHCPSIAHASPTTPPELGAVDPVPPRTLDRNLDANRAMDIERRAFWGLVFATLAALVALVDCIGFLVAYWSDARNLFLGGSLALAFGGLGATLVIWGRMLTVQREAIAPREPLLPPASERKAADDAFTLGAHDIRRRCMLRWIGYCSAGLLAAMAASLLRSLGLPSYAALNSHIWKRGQRLMTAEGEPVSVYSLQPGNTLTVFPEDSIGDERSQTVLVRVDQALLELPKDRENWAPNGILAYSRVCTHAGCTVGLYEKTQYLLLCPCHQSTFDVLRAARPNSGPAARALPQLPIYADSDGTLRAGGGFSEPPGPGFWGMA